MTEKQQGWQYEQYRRHTADPQKQAARNSAGRNRVNAAIAAARAHRTEPTTPAAQPPEDPQWPPVAPLGATTILLACGICFRPYQGPPGTPRGTLGPCCAPSTPIHGPNPPTHKTRQHGRPA